jgi:hypothetical protein
MMKPLIALFLIAALLPFPSLADDSAKVVGTWRLSSFMNEFQDGSEPMAPEGRMMAIVEAEGRKAPQTDEDRAAAFRTIIAYTGTVRFEGDRFITKVDVSWNPAWVGTEQVRTYALSDDRLQIVSPWVMSPNLGKMTRATVVWRRVR